MDGYTNFLFLKKDGTPRVGANYNAMIKGLVKKYNKQHKEQLPTVPKVKVRGQPAELGNAKPGSQQDDKLVGVLLIYRVIL